MFSVRNEVDYEVENADVIDVDPVTGEIVEEKK